MYKVTEQAYPLTICFQTGAVSNAVLIKGKYGFHSRGLIAFFCYSWTKNESSMTCCEACSECDYTVRKG